MTALNMRNLAARFNFIALRALGVIADDLLCCFALHTKDSFADLVGRSG